MTADPLGVIIATVAEYHGWTVDDLTGPTRRPSVVHARHTAMWLCRCLTKASMPVIARRFGRKDHTTVLHACRKMANLADAYPQRLEGVRGKVNDALAAADREEGEELERIATG